MCESSSGHFTITIRNDVPDKRFLKPDVPDKRFLKRFLKPNRYVH